MYFLELNDNNCSLYLNYYVICKDEDELQRKYKKNLNKKIVNIYKAEKVKFKETNKLEILK